MSRAGALFVASRSPLPALQVGSVAKHDRADFAQEFLRRNPAYRAAFAASAHAPRTGEVGSSARNWGLVRFFDPDRPVRGAPAIWRLDAASQVVPLAALQNPFPGAATMPGVPVLVEHRAGGRRHFVIDDRGIRHRFEVDLGDETAPLVILLAPFADPLRVAACDAARRFFANLGTREAAQFLRPSALQRRRLELLLKVLDASLAGVSVRAIGTEIVYSWMAGTGALEWKASSERRRVQRLIAQARDLAAGGYRNILKS